MKKKHIIMIPYCLALSFVLSTPQLIAKTVQAQSAKQEMNILKRILIKFSSLHDRYLEYKNDPHGTSEQLHKIEHELDILQTAVLATGGAIIGVFLAGTGTYYAGHCYFKNRAYCLIEECKKIFDIRFSDVDSEVDRAQTAFEKGEYLQVVAHATKAKELWDNAIEYSNLEITAFRYYEVFSDDNLGKCNIRYSDAFEDKRKQIHKAYEDGKYAEAIARAKEAEEMLEKDEVLS